MVEKEAAQLLSFLLGFCSRSLNSGAAFIKNEAFVVCSLFLEREKAKNGRKMAAQAAFLWNGLFAQTLGHLVATIGTS